MATETPERNVDLLLRCATSLERKPEKWEQGTWITVPLDYSKTEGEMIRTFDVCSTSHCLAGTALLNDDEKQFKKQALLTFKIDVLGVDTTEKEERDHWDYEDWHSYGAKALGLTDQEASFLFQPDGRPVEGMTVAEALRALADGADVTDVWRGSYYYPDYGN